MTLAERLDLHRLPGYLPAALFITAVALGMQFAFVVDAIGASPYPPEGLAWLSWTTLAILAASLVLHAPLSPSEVSVARLRAVAAELRPGGRDVVLAPVEEEATTPPSGRTNGHNHATTTPSPEPDRDLPRLTVRVHSPLSAGPVVAPGEELPITIEAQPPELARQLDVTIQVQGPDGSREIAAALDDTTLVHTETFEEIGPFLITVTLEHPKAEAASKTLRGRVASYREEIGEIFETLKEHAASAGLDVGPQSTPREVCTALRRAKAAGPDELANLAIELEIALYGDDEVDRATYETVYAVIQAVTLDAQEVTG